MKRLFLDLDGVVVDLLTAICNSGIGKKFGLTPELATPELSDFFGMTRDDFWRQFNSIDFWENLPKYSWSDQLVEFCYKNFDLYILTSPSWTATDCASGKLLWLKNNYPKLADEKRMILSNKKHIFANKNSILLDDTANKCELFADNGGLAILFPQIYNQKFCKDIRVRMPKSYNAVISILTEILNNV